MDYNFHTHTWRCGHASGTEREYIEEAIRAGVREMGFSDHAPWRSPDSGEEPSYVVRYAQVEDYFSTVRALREEYAEKITLHVGFEAEFDPVDPEEMIRLGAEYLILGQHFVKNSMGTYTYAGINDQMWLLPRYVDAVVGGIRSGYYTYVAHPDVFNATGDDERVYVKEMHRLCEAAAACSVPLEINFLGIRQRRYYPTDLFWSIAGEVGAPVTFGFDAHEPLAAADTVSVAAAEAFVKKHRLNYIGKPKLVLLS